MNHLDHSRPINLWLVSDSTNFKLLTEDVLTKLELELKSEFNLKRFKLDSYYLPLKFILADLFISFKSDPNKYLTFTRNKSWFSINTRYQPKRFSWSPFCNVIKALESLEYIETIKGFRNVKTGINRNSRVIAKKALIKLFDDIDITTHDFSTLKSKETIILKAPKDENNKKKFLDYNDSIETREMRHNLLKINERIESSLIDLKITDDQFLELQKDSAFTIENKRLSRIFNNGKFNQGGRFYGGWWLSIKSNFRSRIRINGKRTKEVDYSAIHFYMMYAEKSIDIPTSDPYSIKGIERKKAKLALNTALNASSKRKAIKSINKNLWPEKTKLEVTSLVNDLLSKHSPIEDYFFTGKGLSLQYKDSQIAEKVMLNMAKKYNAVVLPVHDSFIVSVCLINELKEEMYNSFNEIVGHIPKVKTNKADERLKSYLEKLSQTTKYNDEGGLSEVGVNAANTWEAYKENKDEYRSFDQRLYTYHKRRLNESN